jgi:hypothetical protein
MELKLMRFLLTSFLLFFNACGSATESRLPATAGVSSIPPCPGQAAYNVAIDVNSPGAAVSIQNVFALTNHYDGAVLIPSVFTQGSIITFYIVMDVASWNINFLSGGGSSESNIGPIDKTGFLNALVAIPGTQLTCGVPIAPNPGVSGGTSN